MDLVKLKNSAREIRDNWEVIESLETNLLDKGNEWIREMALQGQRLIHAKTQLKHGDWMPWVEASFPGKYQRINHCMRIASNLSRVTNLTASESLRQVLALCAPDKPSAGEPKRWPAPIEANYRLSKFVGFVEDHPVAGWPQESKDATREMLLPINKALYPEKFAE